jgi:acyl-CoA synthetase (NDP forming)
VQGLLDLAVALPNRLPARGSRIGIVSASGGAGVMMADRAALRGLQVPALSAATQQALAAVLPPIVGMANPVDYGPVYGDPDAIKRCVELVAADPDVDVVMFFLGLSPGMHGIIEHRLAEVQEACGKPILAAWLGGPRAGVARLRELGIAGFADPARAVDAAAQLVARGRPLPPDPAGERPRAAETRAILAALRDAGRTQLTEREVKALAAGYGIPVVPEVLATTRDEAAAAGRRFGCPMAVKAEAPALLHKSDAGAVRLNVAPADAADAFDAVVTAAVNAVGREGVSGAVIQPMARPGLEIIVGAVHDLQWGATITVGLGGVLSEVMADTVTELAPVNLAIAQDMLARLRGAKLLGPFRGSAARDVAALAALLVRVGDFAADAGPLLAELDLNPVILHAEGEGCTAVDGAAVLGLPEDRSSA